MLPFPEPRSQYSWNQRNIVTMCFLLSELPSNGGRCQCRHFLWRRSCCGLRSGPDCGSSWMMSHPSPLSGCHGTTSASGELTLGPVWKADLKKTKLVRKMHYKNNDCLTTGSILHSCSTWHTVGFEFSRFTAAASCLVYGFYYENVLSATLQPVHSVVILLDVRYNHPAVSRVTQTCSTHRQRTIQYMMFGPHSAFVIKKGDNGAKVCFNQRLLFLTH